jgi:hypothetical protein
MLRKIQKKYCDIDNVVIYKCVNFQNKIYCILGSTKITNFDFIIGEEYTKIYILSFCDLFLFLVGEKYNIFQSRSLYTNRLLD